MRQKCKWAKKRDEKLRGFHMLFIILAHLLRMNKNLKQNNEYSYRKFSYQKTNTASYDNETGFLRNGITALSLSHAALSDFLSCVCVFFHLSDFLPPFLFISSHFRIFIYFHSIFLFHIILNFSLTLSFFSRLEIVVVVVANICLSKNRFLQFNVIVSIFLASN